ncbi:MAG: tyrosine-type recombinase/integrase, partial [Anaerolineaceae bacterium]|nr:tyrosine-type recombinase/integrase [Anaerolineaceae bacterium]
MGDNELANLGGASAVRGEVEPLSEGTSTNPAAVYLAGLAPTGRRSMAAALRRVAQLCGYADWQLAPWTAMRFEHVQAIRSKLLEEGSKPATVNKTLAAIRGVLRAAWRMGQIDAEHYQRACDVDSVAGNRLPAGRAVTQGELAAIMRVCIEDETSAGSRDAAIIALAYGAGLRRAELSALTMDCIAEDEDQYTIRLTGKRQKERMLYLDNGCADALHAWLDVRGAEPGPLFYSGRRGGHLTAGQGMTPQAIRDVVVRRAEQAGVKDVSPHDLRRTFVSDLLDSGV